MKDSINVGKLLSDLRWSKASKEDKDKQIATMNKARILKLKQKKNAKKNN